MKAGMEHAASPRTQIETTSLVQIAERRAAVRFPIGQEVRYKAYVKNTTQAGSGRTLNMSSGGILFTTQHFLSPGTRLELSVNWPAQLDNKCPLKLVASGRIVRVEADAAAMQIDRYEFRTQGANGFSQPKA